MGGSRRDLFNRMLHGGAKGGLGGAGSAGPVLTDGRPNGWPRGLGIGRNIGGVSREPFDMNEHTTEHRRAASRRGARASRTGRRLVLAGLSAAWIAGIAALLTLGSTAAAAG